MNDTPSDDSPSEDEIAALMERASALKEEIETYRTRAHEIDTAFKAANEHRDLSLDDLPFGEELIRTADLPDQLQTVVLTLDALAITKASNAAQVVRDAEHTINEAESTLRDCSALPLA